MINQVFQTCFQRKHDQLDVEISNEGQKHRLKDVPLYGKLLGFFANIFGWAIELKVTSYIGEKTYFVKKEAFVNKGNEKHVDLSNFAKQSVIRVDERSVIPDAIRTTFLERLDAMQRLMQTKSDVEGPLFETPLAREIKQYIQDYPKLRLLIPTKDCYYAIYWCEPTTPPVNFHNIVLVGLGISKEYRYPKWTPGDE